jgi:hypothetical protein
VSLQVGGRAPNAGCAQLASWRARLVDLPQRALSVLRQAASRRAVAALPGDAICTQESQAVQQELLGFEVAAIRDTTEEGGGVRARGG